MIFPVNKVLKITDKIKGKLPVLNVVTGSYDKTKREIKNKMVAMVLKALLQMLIRILIHIFIPVVPSRC